MSLKRHIANFIDALNIDSVFYVQTLHLSLLPSIFQSLVTSR